MGINPAAKKVAGSRRDADGKDWTSAGTQSQKTGSDGEHRSEEDNQAGAGLMKGLGKRHSRRTEPCPEGGKRDATDKVQSSLPGFPIAIIPLSLMSLF